MQGSTQLRARHGDRLADEILHDHEGIVRRPGWAHGGDEVAGRYRDLGLKGAPTAGSGGRKPAQRPQLIRRPCDDRDRVMRSA